jgi:hypothetical protein
VNAPTLAVLPRLALAAAAALALAGCGGGGSSTTTTTTTTTPTTPTTPTLASNQLAVTVEQEPNITSYITANTPYATVSVCDAAGNCSTIDHVLVDTGSYGLRVFASAIGSNVQLTPMTSTAAATAGQPIGECASFISSSVWGPVRLATVHMGSMSVNQVPIQVLADPAFVAATTVESGTTRSVCANATASASEQQFGAKGVLGVGLFKNDTQLYYACTSSSCTRVTPPQQVANPVAALAGDNNGVILSLPAATSVQASVTGVLTFGLDTQSDNMLDGYTVLPATSSGDLTVTMNGASYPASFIDSGSNTNFLDLPSVPVDSNGFYAPTQVTSYPATLSGGSASYASSVTVAAVSPQTLGVAVFPYLAAPSASSQSLDFGLPYFYGKSIAYAIDGATTSHGTGPYYAIH